MQRDPSLEPDSAKAAGEVSESGLDPAPLRLQDQLPLLDPSELDELCDDDDDPLRGQLTAMFLDQARSAITTLTAAIAAGDAATIGRTTHALKGSAAILGARRLAAISSELGDCAACNQLADAPRQLTVLEHVYDLTTVAMSPTSHPFCTSTAAHQPR